MDDYGCDSCYPSGYPVSYTHLDVYKRQVLEVRRSLEELAIELACQRMSEDDMAELERVQDNFKNAIARGEAMSIAQSDEQFHDVIYQGTRNDKPVSYTHLVYVGNLLQLPFVGVIEPEYRK